MSRSRYTVQQVREALDAVVIENPERRDRRAAEDVPGGSRYVEQGQCACLASEILHRLGFSVKRLKTLDKAADGDPIHLSGSDLAAYFEPLAFDLLIFLQNKNDRGWTWGRVREDALTISDFWAHYRKYRYRGKEWLAETPALNDHEYRDAM
jgi:hypothetical protein